MSDGFNWDCSESEDGIDNEEFSQLCAEAKFGSSANSGLDDGQKLVNFGSDWENEDSRILGLQKHYEKAAETRFRSHYNSSWEGNQFVERELEVVESSDLESEEELLTLVGDKVDDDGADDRGGDGDNDDGEAGTGGYEYDSDSSTAQFFGEEKLNDSSTERRDRKFLAELPSNKSALESLSEASGIDELSADENHGYMLDYRSGNRGSDEGEELKYKNMLQGTNYGSKSVDLRNINYFENIGIGLIVVLIYFTVTIALLMGHLIYLPVPDFLFWVYLGMFFGIFFLVATSLGYLVEIDKISVTYSRKTIHVLSFVLPWTLYYQISFKKTLTTYILTFCVSFLAYVPMISDIRDNEYTKIFHYAYSSFNRKNDYPFSLFYAVTQSLGTYVVMLPLGYIVSHVIGHSEFLNIPLMTVAFGDGMAEIVGKLADRAGIAHHYRVKAMFSEEKYQRSIEGSLCVFFACLLSVLIVSLGTAPGVWSPLQICLACAFLPFIATVVEATAWHAWDNAAILLVIGTLMIGIFFIESDNLAAYNSKYPPLDDLIDSNSDGF